MPPKTPSQPAKLSVQRPKHPPLRLPRAPRLPLPAPSPQLRALPPQLRALLLQLRALPLQVTLPLWPAPSRQQLLHTIPKTAPLPRRIPLSSLVPHPSSLLVSEAFLRSVLLPSLLGRCLLGFRGKYGSYRKSTKYCVSAMASTCLNHSFHIIDFCTPGLQG